MPFIFQIPRHLAAIEYSVRGKEYKLTVKILIVGGSEVEIATVERICLQNGWEFRVVSRIGRPMSDHPVQNVLDAYQRIGTVRGVARILDISAPTVSRILKQAGVMGSNSGTR